MSRIAVMTLAVIAMTLAPAKGIAQTLTATASGVAPSASVLPEDTYFLMTVPDAETFSERFGQTRGSGLYTGSETEALREKFLAFWQQANAAAQGQLGFTADDILANAKGELAFAVAQADGKLGGLLFIGFEDENIVDSLVEQVEAAYEGQGGEITRASVEGVEISTAAVPDGEVDPELLSMNYFVADNKWVIGTNRAVLEKVVEEELGRHFPTESGQQRRVRRDVGKGRSRPKPGSRDVGIC